MGHIVTHLAEGADIRTNWVVASINYASAAGGGVTIQAEDGRVVRCKACLVTVALPVLQKGMIAFNPSLPAPKAAAISRIRMGNAVKVGPGWQGPQATADREGRRRPRAAPGLLRQRVTRPASLRVCTRHLPTTGFVPRHHPTATDHHCHFGPAGDHGLLAALLGQGHV